MPSQLSIEARKLLSRWAAIGHCVYLRPMTSKYLDPKAKHTLYWSVCVEFYVGSQFVQRRAEGYDLNEAIIELSATVPTTARARKKKVGWIAPKKKRRIS